MSTTLKVPDLHPTKFSLRSFEQGLNNKEKLNTYKV
jgi:hypothetical protein